MKKLTLSATIPENPSFSGFDIQNLLDILCYKRNLPHLRLEGATYLVTFRFADSIPKVLLLQWQEERDAWLELYGVSSSLSESDPVMRYAIYNAIPIEHKRRFELQQA